MPRRRRRARGRNRGQQRRSLIENDTTGITLVIPDRPVRVNSISRVVAISTDGLTATAPFNGAYAYQFNLANLGSTTVLYKLATVYRYYKIHSIRYFFVSSATTNHNGFRLHLAVNDDPVTNLSGDTAPTTSTILNQGRVACSVCLFNYHSFPIFRSRRGWLFTDIQAEGTAAAQRQAYDHELFGLLEQTAVSITYGQLWAEIDVSFRGPTFNRTIGLEEKMIEAPLNSEAEAGRRSDAVPLLTRESSGYVKVSMKPSVPMDITPVRGLSPRR